MMHEDRRRELLRVQPELNVYIRSRIGVYTLGMTKRLVDIDDAALARARNALGTSTIKDTVDQALRATASPAERRLADVHAAFDTLAAAHVSESDREAAWR